MNLILMILCFETYAAMRFRIPPPPLFKAIKKSNCNVSLVRKLASRHTVNERFDNSYPLKLAIKERKYEIVEVLLDAGADVNPSLGSEEKPPLFLACRGGKTAVLIVQLLLNHGADSTVLVNGEDLFSYCIRRKVWSVAKYLLDRPDVIVDVNRIFADGEENGELSLFMHCCITGNNFRGNCGLVKAMLEKKNPDLEWTDGKRRTPIFHVTWDGTGNLARIMIAKGAYVHHQDASGATPIHKAVDVTNANMLRVLLENGANPNAFSILLRPNSVEIKEYPICVAFNRFKILQKYLDRRFAAPIFTSKMIKCVRLLLQAGADVTVEDAINGRRIIENIIDTISPLKYEKILAYTPILLDLLEIGALKLEQLDDFKIFSIISPRECSFLDYFRKLFYTVQPIEVIGSASHQQVLAADINSDISTLEEKHISHFCAVVMKYYEHSNKIRLPRVYEFVIEDKVFEIYYAKRERIFALTYLNTIPLDLFKSIWMDAINPEVAEKCKLRGLSLRVLNLLRLDAFVKEENFDLNVWMEEIRPILNDLIDELEPKLTEVVEVHDNDYEYSPKFDDGDTDDMYLGLPLILPL